MIEERFLSTGYSCWLSTLFNDSLIESLIFSRNLSDNPNESVYRSGVFKGSSLEPPSFFVCWFVRGLMQWVQLNPYQMCADRSGSPIKGSTELLIFKFIRNWFNWTSFICCCFCWIFGKNLTWGFYLDMLITPEPFVTGSTEPSNFVNLLGKRIVRFLTWVQLNQGWLNCGNGFNWTFCHLYIDYPVGSTELSGISFC